MRCCICTWRRRKEKKKKKESRPAVARQREAKREETGRSQFWEEKEEMDESNWRGALQLFSSSWVARPHAQSGAHQSAPRLISCYGTDRWPRREPIYHYIYCYLCVCLYRHVGGPCPLPNKERKKLSRGDEDSSMMGTSGPFNQSEKKNSLKRNLSHTDNNKKERRKRISVSNYLKLN